MTTYKKDTCLDVLHSMSGDPHNLGTVRLLDDVTEGEIKLLWENFQDTEPGSNDEFIKYMIDERPDVFAAAESNPYIFVGW